MNNNLQYYEHHANPRKQLFEQASEPTIAENRNALSVLTKINYYSKYTYTNLTFMIISIMNAYTEKGFYFFQKVNVTYNLLGNLQ